MKNRRFQFPYRHSASKLHIAIGELLRGSKSFVNQNIYQEYPVNRVNESYPDGSHHFDWVIPGLKLVFECHGRQHYEVTKFQTMSDEDAIQTFKELRERDFAKRDAALAAGFIYIEIPYTLEKTINEAKLLDLLEVARNELSLYEKEIASKTINELDKIHQIEREKREREEQHNLQLEEMHKEQLELERERHQDYLESTAHKAKLQAARSIRQERYRKLKEKYSESKSNKPKGS